MTANSTEYQRKWNRTHPGKNAAYQRSHRDRWRTAAYTALGNQCAVCGDTDLTVMQIDHVNGGGAAHRRSLGGSQNKFYKELAEGRGTSPCQLLCGNCHNRKSYNR